MVAEDLVGCPESLLGVSVAVIDEAFECQGLPYGRAEGRPLQETGEEGGFVDVEFSTAWSPRRVGGRVQGGVLGGSPPACVGTNGWCIQEATPTVAWGAPRRAR